MFIACDEHVRLSSIFLSSVAYDITDYFLQLSEMAFFIERFLCHIFLPGFRANGYIKQLVTTQSYTCRPRRRSSKNSWQQFSECQSLTSVEACVYQLWVGCCLKWSFVIFLLTCMKYQAQSVFNS